MVTQILSKVVGMQVALNMVAIQVLVLNMEVLPVVLKSMECPMLKSPVE